jgi:hypothetical protein
MIPPLDCANEPNCFYPRITRITRIENPADFFVAVNMTGNPNTFPALRYTATPHCAVMQGRSLAFSFDAAKDATPNAA